MVGVIFMDLIKDSCIAVSQQDLDFCRTVVMQTCRRLARVFIELLLGETNP
jgi:hypothetical protein